MSTISSGTTSTTTLVHSGDTTGSLVFKTNDTGSGGTTAMTIDTSQNVLVGTTNNAFSSRLCVQGTAGSSTPDVTIGIPVNSSGNTQLQIYRSASTSGYIGLESVQAGVTGGNLVINAVNGGKLLVGSATAPSVTSSSLAGYGLGFNNDYSGGNAIVINSTSTSSNQYYIGFGRGSAQAGYILSSTTNSTTYSTSSDYRLKTNITPMSNALDKVALLKPCTWKWKLDNTSSQGFIAHELAEVIPEAVAGTKDEVDVDGNPRYQGVDTSFVVATLVASIQELKAIVDAQATEIAQLKAKVG